MLNKRQRQFTNLDFEGQNIYVGIDTHKKDWRIALYHDEVVLKNFTQPSKPELLEKQLKKNYPGANFICGYEAGFCGFWIQKYFTKKGIECKVLNPADVPTSHKEKEFKTDPRDARKIAKALKSKLVEGIFIHSDQGLEARHVVRYYHDMSRNYTRFKNKVKGFLNFYGIQYPQEFASTNNHWSRSFYSWLQTIVMSSEEGNFVLKSYINECLKAKEQKRIATAKVRELSRKSVYKEMCEYLRSIPGVGLITSMTYLTEVGEINRFRNLNKLSAYIGLVPSSNSSGEKERTGEITNRGNKYLKNQIIESAWMAIRKDPVLLSAYLNHRKRMDKNKAIIHVARKLVARMIFVTVNKKHYEIRTGNK
jgi:transposase